MAEKYFVCPTCRTALRKPKNLFDLGQEMEEKKHKLDVIFMDIKPTSCPVCRSNIETEQIVKGAYDKKRGPNEAACGAALGLAILSAFAVSALLESGWFFSFLLSFFVLATIFCLAVWLGLGGKNTTVVPQYREKARLYRALEIFHCDRCDHPFKNDNAFYPRDGRLPAFKGVMKCANPRCGATLLEFGLFGRILFGIVAGAFAITVYAWIAAAIIEANSNVRFPQTVFGMHIMFLVAAIGAVVGVVFLLHFRADRIRGLQEIAMQQIKYGKRPSS